MHGIEQVEETLVRELHQVADGVEVPVLPPLPEQRPSTFPRTALLVAAAAVLVVLATVATVAMLGGDERIQPAPAPAPDRATEGVSTAPTDVPHLLGQRLFVAGEQVPGDWVYVRGTSTGWIGMRADGTQWVGDGPEPRRAEGSANYFASISPDGRYEARFLPDQGERGTLVGSETETGGEGLGGVQVPATSRGLASRVVAVTDDGLVVVRGGDFSLLWRPLAAGGTVDLEQTAPGQMVVDNTQAGLVVVEGDDNTIEATDGEPYLAEVSEDGTMRRLQSVPAHDYLMANDKWLAWVPPGTVGGEVAVVEEMQVQRRDGSDAGVIAPPEGWDFRVAGWRWEDDDHLVATVNDGTRERMVRCALATRECVLIENP